MYSPLSADVAHETLSEESISFFDQESPSKLISSAFASLESDRVGSTPSSVSPGRLLSGHSDARWALTAEVRPSVSRLTAIEVATDVGTNTG